MHTKGVRNIVFTLFVLWVSPLFSPSAQAMNTASSFDLSWAYTSLKLDGLVDNASTVQRSLNSPTGLQIDYNIAMFDLKTVGTISFTQFATSNIGSRPLTRLSFGGSYHFLRMNGQRMILDNQVEAKSWGISPAFELTIGLSYLSINDPDNSNFVFTTSKIDVSPRLLIEIPASPSFLIVVRVGILKSLSSGGGASRYDVNYGGLIANLGFKLTTF
jgi:hypothetical protein